MLPFTEISIREGRGGGPFLLLPRWDVPNRQHRQQERGGSKPGSDNQSRHFPFSSSSFPTLTNITRTYSYVRRCKSSLTIRLSPSLQQFVYLANLHFSRKSAQPLSTTCDQTFLSVTLFKVSVVLIFLVPLSALRNMMNLSAKSFFFQDKEESINWVVSSSMDGHYQIRFVSRLLNWQQKAFGLVSSVVN